jgi:iron complex outermembrane receptor protein
VTTNSILQNNGIELDLTYKILKNKPLKWETNLQMSIIKTQKIGPITTLGFGGRPLITDNIGEPLGQITVFRAGDIVNGTMRGRDINGDGRLNNEDVVIAGQGLPAFVLNGSNQLIYKQLGLSIVGRGAFGHSLLNMYRTVFETFGTTTLKFSNQIRTTKANPKVSNRTFLTDDLVENASFFTLEHIALSYTMNSFPCHYKWRPHFVKILLTAHHLWTFTNYTGVSPEVRYEAVDKTKRFTQYALTPGVESLYSYFPARSFSLGLEIHF